MHLKKYLPKEVSLRVAYQKPQSIKSMCSKPRSLEAVEGKSGPCGKCKLCGTFGKPRGVSMVPAVTSLKINNKNFKITANLDCAASGIYVAICTTCDETYVGQTSTKFSTRFNGHRGKWVNATESQNRDDTALLDHYREFHKNIYEKWCKDYPASRKEQSGFDRAFKIVFVDRVGDNLLQQEDFWKKTLEKFDQQVQHFTTINNLLTIISKLLNFKTPICKKRLSIKTISVLIRKSSDLQEIYE